MVSKTSSLTISLTTVTGTLSKQIRTISDKSVSADNHPRNQLRGFLWYILVMSLPTKPEATALLETHVTDPYQRFHASMVGTALAGYARTLAEDEHLWFITGYLHDIDYDQHPTEHPGPSLQWFAKWGYPPELIQAVEAHANGFNSFTTPATSKLDKALIACDEICGIFYAYQKLNPIPFGDMKVKSIKKRLKEERFAPGIDRSHIYAAVDAFGLSLDEHIAHLITFLGELDSPVLRKEAEEPATS